MAILFLIVSICFDGLSLCSAFFCVNIRFEHPSWLFRGAFQLEDSACAGQLECLVWEAWSASRANIPCKEKSFVSKRKPGPSNQLQQIEVYL
jgi:hypothetical protein